MVELKVVHLVADLVVKMVVKRDVMMVETLVVNMAA